jgi:hypothetical protein
MTTKHGGQRPGAGRKRKDADVRAPVLGKVNIRISPAAASKLGIVVRHHQIMNPEATEESIVTNWIEAAWSELDEVYQTNAEQQEE